MNSFLISASGVRGIVGQTFTPEIVARFSAAFGNFVRKGRVVVGSDTRTSNQMLSYAVFSGLLSVGCEIVDAGVCPTPSLQLMVEELKADGGIAITGSHNPIEWNALKFIRPDGLFLYPEQGKELLELYRTKKIERVLWNGIKKVHQETSAIENHLEKVLTLVDKGKIKSKKFKVVLDVCNGAGALISPELIRRLGCEVVELNCEPNGIFSHPPEPIPSNLKELSEIVKAEGADVGFAHDADADRVALVSEEAEILPESYSLLLASKFILRKKKGLVVTNLSTTQALDDIAREFSCYVKRTKVGDIYVSRCMREEGAVIGGEGNGGVIIPQIHYARDGIAAIALLLEYMATSNKSLSELADEIPRYYMIKGKTNFPKENLSLLKVDLRREFEEDKLNFLDGVKVYLSKGWVHIRASGTEPVVRIIVEAKNKKDAEALYNLGLRYLNNAKN